MKNIPSANEGFKAEIERVAILKGFVAVRPSEFAPDVVEKAFVTLIVRPAIEYVKVMPL